MSDNSFRRRYKTSVFLSYPKPYARSQEEFVEQLCAYLDARGLAPRTLGVTDYDMSAPLTAVRRLMLESNGLITIAFRRMHLRDAVLNDETDNGAYRVKPEGEYLTSPWCQIEPAMAYQLGLPILILRESGVVAEGLLQHGAVGMYMPSFDLANSASSYLNGPEFSDLIEQWEHLVKTVVKAKGEPPSLY